MINYVNPGVYPMQQTAAEQRKEVSFLRLSDSLNKISNKKKKDVYNMGNFNGRVGKKRAQQEFCLDNFGDITTECYSSSQMFSFGLATTTSTDKVT